MAFIYALEYKGFVVAIKKKGEIYGFKILQDQDDGGGGIVEGSGFPSQVAALESASRKAESILEFNLGFQASLDHLPCPKDASQNYRNGFKAAQAPGVC